MTVMNVGHEVDSHCIYNSTIQYGILYLYLSPPELLQRNVWENVSVSVVQGQMNSGGTMLSWNLTAPCRVEAEVWPCQKEAGLDMDRCTELVAFRQRLSDDIWRENSRGHWVRISNHLIDAFDNFFCFLLVRL